MSFANPLWGAPRIHGELLKLGIRQVLIAPRSPWQNPCAERVIGSIRRECLDHVIVLNERHLKRILRSYFRYYHRSRTHLSLGPQGPPANASAARCGFR
jgi:transposase InsO family protein